MKKYLLFVLFFVATCYSLELINANTNSNRFEKGSIVSVLSGNVEFLWNDTRIFSDRTIWRRGTGHLQMFGNIKVLRNKQELQCDTTEFRSSGKMLQLRGKVWGVDTNYCATMLSGKADYSIRNDSVFLSVKPIIHFWDSTTTDTISIFSKTMNYTSKTGIAKANENVKITGTDFVAFADTGFYFAETERGLMVGNPRIEYQNNSSVSGDTIHVLFKNNALTEFFVVGNPIGKTSEEEKSSDSAGIDSTFMELTGDTIRFLLGDRQIEQIISEQNAQIKRFRLGCEETSDKMWGKRIVTTLNSTDCGEGNNVSSVVSGNAKAIYYDNKTRNESAGDSLKLFFDDNGVTKVQILGKVKGRVEN